MDNLNSDIEIARNAKLLSIKEVLKGIGVDEEKTVTVLLVII